MPPTNPTSFLTCIQSGAIIVPESMRREFDPSQATVFGGESVMVIHMPSNRGAVPLDSFFVGSVNEVGGTEFHQLVETFRDAPAGSAALLPSDGTVDLVAAGIDPLRLKFENGLPSLYHADGSLIAGSLERLSPPDTETCLRRGAFYFVNQDKVFFVAKEAAERLSDPDLSKAIQALHVLRRSIESIPERIFLAPLPLDVDETSFRESDTMVFYKSHGIDPEFHRDAVLEQLKRYDIGRLQRAVEEGVPGAEWAISTLALFGNEGAIVEILRQGDRCLDLKAIYESLQFVRLKMPDGPMKNTIVKVISTYDIDRFKKADKAGDYDAHWAIQIPAFYGNIDAIEVMVQDNMRFSPDNVRDWLEKKLQAQMERLGPDHPDVVHTRLRLAEVMEFQIDYEKSLEQTNAALEVLEGTPGISPASLMFGCYLKAKVILKLAGPHPEAVNALERAIVVFRDLPGDAQRSADVTLACLYSMKVLMALLSASGEHQRWYEAALAALSQEEKSPKQAEALLNLMIFSFLVGAREQMSELRQRALDLFAESPESEWSFQIIHPKEIEVWGIPLKMPDFGPIREYFTKDYRPFLRRLADRLARLAGILFAAQRLGDAGYLSNMAGVFLETYESMRALKYYSNTKPIKMTITGQLASVLCLRGDILTAARDTGASIPVERVINFYEMAIRSFAVVQATANDIEDPEGKIQAAIEALPEDPTLLQQWGLANDPFVTACLEKIAALKRQLS